MTPDDDFFNSGGHSLLAAQLVWELNTIFEIELPLGQVFESPRFGELANAIAKLRVEADLVPAACHLGHPTDCER